MTNEQRQKSLDKQKWIMSETVGEDLSGEMLYCESCSYREDNRCTITQERKNTLHPCATAYNRMKRRSV